jgi:hypothetical protein
MADAVVESKQGEQFETETVAPPSEAEPETAVYEAEVDEPVEAAAEAESVDDF